MKTALPVTRFCHASRKVSFYYLANVKLEVRTMPYLIATHIGVSYCFRPFRFVHWFFFNGQFKDVGLIGVVGDCRFPA